MILAVTLTNVEKDRRCRFHSLTFHPIRQTDHRKSRPTVVVCWSADLCQPRNSYIIPLGFESQRYEPALPPPLQYRGNGPRMAGQWSQEGRFHCEGIYILNFLISCSQTCNPGWGDAHSTYHPHSTSSRRIFTPKNYHHGSAHGWCSYHGFHGHS